MARRTKAEVAALTTEIVKLILRHYTQEEVARELGISQAHVSSLARRFYAAVDAELSAPLIQQRQIAIKRFRRIAMESAEAWERSKKLVNGVATKVGNPTFLRRWMQAENEIAKLMNLYPAKRLELTGHDGGPIELDQDEARHQIVLSMFERQLAKGLTLDEARECVLDLGVDDDDVDAAYTRLLWRKPDAGLGASPN